MRELSRRVLAMAICQAGAWFRLERPWRVAANLSATDLLDRSLVDDVSALLRRYGTPAGRVTLEVTESVLMTDPARAMKVLAELRGLGVQLALDDFGTGLVVADPPAAHARPRDQDRPLVRRGHGHRGQLGRDRLLHRRPRPRAGPARRRRGDRGRGDVAAAARRGLRRGPGLPPLAPDARRRVRDHGGRDRRALARWRRAFPCPPPDRHCPPFIASLAPFISNGRPFTFGEALPWSSIGVRTGQTRREAGTQSQRSLADGSATGSPGARTKDGV